MSDRDALTPRVFLVRHGKFYIRSNLNKKHYVQSHNPLSTIGETTWAKSGRYTGTTDIELTPEGIAQVSSTAAMVVGAGKLVDPTLLAEIIVSPRKRAKETFELLLLPPSSSAAGLKGGVTYTEDIAEWNYGEYEGLDAEGIRKLRKEKGLDREKEWDIWRDGCEGGEYVALAFIYNLLVGRY